MAPIPADLATLLAAIDAASGNLGPMSDEPEVLFEGRHMLFLRRKGWEYVEHRTAPEAAMIVAITPDDEIVLAEEFRLPMNAPVLSLPAGLVGDEGPEDADGRRAPGARRRRRDTRRPRSSVLAKGPGSAGQSSEMITFFLARGRGALRRAGGARRRQDPRPRRSDRRAARVGPRARSRGRRRRPEDLGRPLPRRPALKPRAT